MIPPSLHAIKAYCPAKAGVPATQGQAMPSESLILPDRPDWMRRGQVWIPQVPGAPQAQLEWQVRHKAYIMWFHGASGYLPKTSYPGTHGKSHMETRRKRPCSSDLGIASRDPASIECSPRSSAQNTTEGGCASHTSGTLKDPIEIRKHLRKWVSLTMLVAQTAPWRACGGILLSKDGIEGLE